MTGSVTLRLTGDMPGSPDGRIQRAIFYDILSDGRRVGTCELRPDPTWASALGGQMAYTVFPRERGHGFAAQAVRLMLDEAARMGVGQLRAACRPENGASRRTLENASARFLGIQDVPAGHPLAGVCDRLCVYEWNLNGSLPNQNMGGLTDETDPDPAGCAGADTEWPGPGGSACGGLRL